MLFLRQRWNYILRSRFAIAPFFRNLLVHRGVQMIHPSGALVWLDPATSCGMQRHRAMTLLSAPGP